MSNPRPALERRALLLTDVVDSTKLVRQLGDVRAAEVWARHDTLARALLAPHDGLEIDKTDGFLMIFPEVGKAVRYAVAYHRALARVSVELGVPLSARAGIHVGEVILRRNPPEQVALGAKPLEVEGLAKPTAARVMSLAGARQTLLTEEARAELDDPELSVVSHGHWRVKGIDTPIEIFEVGAQDAPFTPPPDGEKVYRVVRRDGVWAPVREVPTDLGPPPDPFFGRERELQELARALAEGAGLVTLTGAARSGKARLASRYGRLWLGDWPAGVWSVDARVGLGGPWAGRCLLIVTHADRVPADTIERLRGASPDAVMVVTRRDRLDLPGERVIPVGPLAAEAAVALFEDRARATDPGRAVDPEQALAVTALLGCGAGDVERAAILSRSPGRDRPFLGLRSFGTEDGDRFFGRDTEARNLAERVRHDPLVTVTGASGSGKTSLLQAGVGRHLPEFDVAVIRPGPQPVSALLGFLQEMAPRCVGPVFEAMEAGFATLEPMGGQRPGPSRPLLLVVDQAEEVLTLVSDPVERDRFGVALVAFASLPNARVALAVREDFFARLADVGALKGRYHRSLEVLTRPDPAALLQTMVRPAALFGHRFEEGLAERMVEEVAREPAALALLQFCADQLWERRDPVRGMLTWDGYREVGGVTGALTVHADKVVSALAPSERGEARRQILRLVTPQITKEPRARGELIDSAAQPDRAGRVLDSLIGARLLTAFEADDGTIMVELVHEALLRHWAQLREWLGEDEEGQRMTRSLRAAAEEWDRRGQSQDLLWRGAPLVQLDAWRERASPTLTALEQAFADTSARVARRRRLAWWAAGLTSAGVLVVIAIGSLLLFLNAEAARVRADAAAARALEEGEKARSAERVAEQERQRAEEEQKQAVAASATAIAARQEADLQRTEAEREAENARIQEGIAREALSAAEEERIRAERAAQTILDAQRLFAVSELRGDPARAAPFLADVDPTTLPERWRAAAVELVQRPWTLSSARFPANAHPAVAPSPSGGWAVSSGERLSVWDGRGARQAVASLGPSGGAVAWAPDGETLAASTADGALRLYRRGAAGWAEGPVLQGHARAPQAASFAPDGRRVVSASPDGTARIWSADGAGEPVVLQVGAAVWSARFLGGAAQVLTAAANGEVAVWDAVTGAARWRTRGESAVETVATAAAWHPGTGNVAAAWSDRTLRVFDGAGAVVARLEGAPSWVAEVSFRGDAGDQVFGRGQGGEVSRWVRGADGAWVRHALPLPMERARDLELSPDGRWLAVAGTGGGVAVIELGPDGRPLERAVLRGHDPGAEVLAVAFSPGSDQLFTLGADGAARRWPVRGGGLGRRVDGVDGSRVVSLSYGADASLQVALQDGGRLTVPTGAAPPDAAAGPTVVTGDDGSVELRQGEAPPIPLLGHLAPVRASAVLGGRQVATASDDGTLRLWDLPDDDALRSRLLALPVGCIGAADRQRYLAEDEATATAAAHACAHAD